MNKRAMLLVSVIAIGMVAIVVALICRRTRDQRFIPKRIDSTNLSSPRIGANLNTVSAAPGVPQAGSSQASTSSSSSAPKTSSDQRWGRSEALAASSAEYPKLTQSVAQASQFLIASGLMRTNEALLFLASATNFFRQGEEMLNSPKTAIAEAYGQRTAVHTNELTGDYTYFLFSTRGGKIQSIQRRGGTAASARVEALNFNENGDLNTYIYSFLDPFFHRNVNEVIGLDASGAPRFLNVALSSNEFLGATFRNGRILRQKIRDASKMTSEKWRR